MIAAQAKLKKSSIDPTEGPILSKLILFVLPVMATNLLQTFYNVADMMIVSLSDEPNAVGAIGLTGSFVGLIVNFFMGFSVGTNVIVARYLGAKDDKNVSRTVHTSLIMSIVVGIAAMIGGSFISRPVLSLMGTEGNLLDLATTYTKIYFIGVPFISLTNYVAAIFRAKGDTKTPLYVLSASGLVNVGLNFVFVLGFHMSVEGVAIATAVSNLLAAIVLVWRLAKDDSPCRFSFSKLRVDRRSLTSIIGKGLPAGIQSVMFSLSNMLIQSSIIQINNSTVPAGSQFEPVVNGNSAVANLESFLYNAVHSVYQAAITFTSQHVGAAKYKRIWRVMASSILFSVAVSIVSAAIIIIFKDPLLALYGIKDGAAGSLEHIAYDSAMTRIIYLFLPYSSIAAMDSGSGIVHGLGKATLSTVISFIGVCLLRVVWIAVVFKEFPTLETIYISYPISWVITGAAQVTAAAVVLKKMIKNQKKHCLTT